MTRHFDSARFKLGASLSCLARAMWAAAAATTALVIFHANAAACSYPRPGIFGRTVYPPSGTNTLPRNTQFVVSYETYHHVILGGELTLRDASGQPVRSQITKTDTQTADTLLIRQQTFVLKPETELPPGRYDLVDQSVVPCQGAGASCQLAQAASFASFEITSGSDVTPPSFAGAEALQAVYFDTCDNEACCTPTVARLYYLRHQPGLDQVTSPLRSHLYGPNGNLLVPFLATTFSDGTATITLSVRCAGRPSLFGVSTTAGAHFLRAVDWAGNEDDNQVIREIVDPCANAPGFDGKIDAGASSDGPQVDADGPTAQDAASSAMDAAPVRDAGVDADAPAAHRSASGGCDCNLAGRSATPAGDAALVIAAMMVAMTAGWLRRRRCP